MPSCNAYCLTWVSLTLDVGYLFMAAPAKRSLCSLPWTRSSLLALNVEKLLSALLHPHSCRSLDDRMISVRCQSKPSNITVITAHAPTSNAEEAEAVWFYEDLQDLLELTPPKDVLLIIGDWNAKVGSQETPGVTGNFGLGVQNEADQTVNLQMFKLDLEKAEEPEIKLPTSVGSLKSENSRKTSTSALLITPKPLTVWITTNCGKFFKRWECQTT